MFSPIADHFVQQIKKSVALLQVLKFGGKTDPHPKFMSVFSDFRRIDEVSKSIQNSKLLGKNGEFNNCMFQCTKWVHTLYAIFLPPAYAVEVMFL